MDASYEDDSKAVTMKDVAKAAGVAVSTVSYALKNNPKIPLATRQRIQDIAEEIGYKPDAYVATLMARLHNRRLKSEQAVLGLLVEQGVIGLLDKVTYHGDWHRGMNDRAHQLGYKIDRFIWEPDAMPAKRMVTSLVTRGIRGILVAPYLQGDTQLDFPFDDFACASTGVSLRHPELHRVTTDYAHSIDLAYQRLRELGYRKPGLVIPAPFNEHTGSACLGAYLSHQILSPTTAAIPPCLTAEYDVQVDEILPWFQEHRPDVLLTVLPEQTEACLKAKFQSPADYGIIDLTCDNVGKYAGIGQPGFELGQAVVDLVVHQIHRGVVGVPESSQTTLIKGHWVNGKTLRRQSP